jgi:hypothetical protein
MSLAQKVDPGNTWQACSFLASLTPRTRSAPKKDEKDEENRDRRDYRYEGRMERIRWDEPITWPMQDQRFEVRDAATGQILWQKDYNRDVPFISTNGYTGVATLRWYMGQDGAKAEMKSVSLVNRDSAETKTLDYMVEVLDLGTGKFLNGMIIDNHNGAYPIDSTMATRDWIVAHDRLGRTLSYSLKTGKCTGKVFGTPISISAQDNSVVVEHGAGRLGVYDLQNMREIEELVFSYPVSHVAFSRDGKKLIVVTTDEMVYVLDSNGVKH